MNIHQNARLTPSGRERLARSGLSVPRVAETMGVCAKTVRKWLACFAAEGRAGERIPIDIKKLGRFARTGHRITGDRTGQSSGRGIGWEYLHLAVDDQSRLAYSEIHPDEKRGSCLAFLFNALRFFKRHGVSVERTTTDNGSAFRSKRCATALRRLRTTHKRTRPYTPKTNGKAERFVQTSLRKWAYARAYDT